MATAHPFLFILIAVFGLLSLMILAPFWAFAVGGLVLAYIGNPIYQWMRRRVKGDGFAAGLAILVIIIGILIPMGFVGYHLTLQAQGLVSGLSGQGASDAIGRFANYTHANYGWPETTENQTAAQAAVEEVVPRVRQAMLAWLPDAAAYVTETLVGMTVSLFIAYYGLREGPRFVRWLQRVMPLRPQTEERLFREGAETIQAVLWGQIATSAAIGLVGGFGLWITGVPAPIFWGFAMAVLSLLPVIGATLIWLPASIFLLAVGNTLGGIGLLVWGTVVVSSVDNIVKPMVIGKGSGLHPAVALLAAIGGLVAFGFMGFVVGPLVLAVFLILINDYVEQREDQEAGSALASIDESDPEGDDVEDMTAPEEAQTGDIDDGD